MVNITSAEAGKGIAAALLSRHHDWLLFIIDSNAEHCKKRPKLTTTFTFPNGRICTGAWFPGSRPRIPTFVEYDRVFVSSRQTPLPMMYAEVLLQWKGHIDVGRTLTATRK
ncbi:hypothetical protein RB195_001944 [Necator americanus]|uniref:Uncharacterized protein n=1 Tax=Necator americanus TaxID=51031 RepID=A0ABR1DGM4_NECAM